MSIFSLQMLIHFYHSGLFGRYKGGPEVPRKVISEGILVKELRIEVYPLCLKLIDARDDSQRTIRIISRKVPSCIFFVSALTHATYIFLVIWSTMVEEATFLDS